MSSYYVRDTSERWAQAVSARIPVVPYHATVNMEQDPNDRQWVTLEWNAFGATKASFCQDFVEDGQITLTFFGSVGNGYSALMQDAEAYAEQFFNSIDPSGKLMLVTKNPPDEFGAQDGPWFIVTIPIDYQYYR